MQTFILSRPAKLQTEKQSTKRSITPFFITLFSIQTSSSANNAVLRFSRTSVRAFCARCPSFPELSTQRPAMSRQVSGASELPSLPQRLVTTSIASFSIHQRNDYSQDFDYTMLVHRLKQEEKKKERRLGGVFCT